LEVLNTDISYVENYSGLLVNCNYCPDRFNPRSRCQLAGWLQKDYYVLLLNLDPGDSDT